MSKFQISLLGDDSLDNEFFEFFHEFPVAEVPENVDDLFSFKEKLEIFLNYAEVKDVDVVLTYGEKSRIIPTIEEFEFILRQFRDIEKTENTEALNPGNYWAIASDPFVVNPNSNPYDNADPILTKWETPMVEPWDPVPVMVTPDSNFDKTSTIPSGGSELRIVDRLARYGESMPFLNEDGTLSDAAKADFDKLLNEGEADQALLAFLKGGIDLADDVFSKAKGAAKAVGDALGVTTDGKRAKVEKMNAKQELADAKIKDKATKIVSKLSSNLEKAVTAAGKVNVDAVVDGDAGAKEDYHKAIGQLNNVEIAAENAKDKGVTAAGKIATKAEDTETKLKDERAKSEEEAKKKAEAANANKSGGE